MGAGYALIFVVIATVGSHPLGKFLSSYYLTRGIEIPLAVRILMALIAFWMTFWWVFALPLVCFGACVGAVSAAFARRSKPAIESASP